MVHPRERIEYRIGALKSAGLWREPEVAAEVGLAGGHSENGVVDARSNDYLGLAGRAVSRETVHVRIGAGASRLVSGTWPEHLALEADIAAWLGTEACLVFSSGYSANVGVISALAGPGEVVLSDALNHASIIDGCRLSRAEVVVLPHRDLHALERALASGRGVRWVVTESYFGMDGDSPDLVAMRELCDRHDAALVVDEAHALGVFGPEGRGLCAAVGVVPDVLVGGMGKALGIHGGFAASRRVYRDWLWNRARSMVFSTAPSPALCEHARERVRQVRAADAERAVLRRLEAQLAAALARSGIASPEGRHGPLFPVVLGTEAAVLAGAAKARDHGVLCHPIRPPTVPRGQSRLRITLRSDLSARDVDRIGVALEAAWAVRMEPGTDEAGEGTALAPRSHEPDDVPSRASSRRSSSPSGASPPAEASHPRALGSDTGSLLPEPADARRPEPRHPEPRRWVILGTGTGVGKTFVARALVQAIAERGHPAAGLKPIETGLGLAGSAGASDAAELASLAFCASLPSPHPLYGFAEPVTPSRAARTSGQHIELQRIASWVRGAAATEALPLQVIIETAGGVFSPLTDQHSNFDLAKVLDPSIWVLVAPNRLGVLHDVTSALRAMAALGRQPDWIILSAPEAPDPSTPTNREELGRLHSTPVVELPRNDPRPLAVLLAALAPRPAPSSHLR